MRPPWREDTGILPWLFLLALVLGIALLVKDGYLTQATFKDNKDSFAAVASLTTACVLLLGGFLSYVRFFKGRTLKSKLNLELKAGSAPASGGYLHWVEAEIKNTGTVTVWHYRVKATAILHKGLIACSVEVGDFIQPPDASRRYTLIDVGESAYEQAFLLVPEEVDAVTFIVEVSDKSDHLWTRSVTAKNVEPQK